jgi:gamma-glutamyltranspeptidase/glutathione hydrolase
VNLKRRIDTDTRRYWRFCLVLLAGFLLLAPPLWADSPEETPGVPAMSLPDTAKGAPPSWAGKAFRQGVVAVSHPLATEAGAAALENGVNAFDAAAAVQFASEVVEPQYSGIAGGGFMMIHLAKTNETFARDCREKAPAAATPTMFGSLNFTQASTSGISVGVPGTLMCLATALQNWRTTSLAQALQPAIKLAAEGFPRQPVPRGRQRQLPHHLAAGDQSDVPPAGWFTAPGGRFLSAARSCQDPPADRLEGPGRLL